MVEQGAGETPRSEYQRGRLRMLVDLEIPAWGEGFLSEFDPEAMADLYQRAGAESVMFACKNLSGLCFWPTAVGEMHPRLGGRDVTAEAEAALRERGIATCAYYSVIFDNWAHEHDATWRFQSMRGADRRDNPHDRYGLCCPNSPGYREYIAAQIADLYGRYSFECAFCDMTFWPGVCECSHCRERFAAEVGGELPRVVDWTDPRWCAFQAARERWILEFAALVTDSMRAASPGIAVYHNFAPALITWEALLPFGVTEHSDFLGGDLYGDPIEQDLVTKLMADLSRSRPAEFMTFATEHCEEHVTLKSRQQLRSQVLASVSEATAFMFIEAINPDGSPNAPYFEEIGEVYEEARPLEQGVGGEPVAEAAIYFSNESKMDFDHNGLDVADVPADDYRYPHLEALRGAARSLERAHVPFAVVTRRQLEDLDRYPVLVLAGVSRLDRDEVEAIRAYVRGGGRLYASRYTSLVETSDGRQPDFMLADVFGASLEAEEESRAVYAKPAAPALAAATAPQDFLTSDQRRGALAGGLLRLRAEAGAETLATLSLPYGHPHGGHHSDQNWASMHSSPPWEDTGSPLVVANRFGAGRCIYSAIELERGEAEANQRAFAALVLDLLGERRSAELSAPPELRLTVFDQPDESAYRVTLLNTPALLTGPVELRLRPPAGASFDSLEALPGGEPLELETDADGTLVHRATDLPEITILMARYRREG